MRRGKIGGLALVSAVVLALAGFGPVRVSRAGCDTELEAIGAVSASYLYTTYTAIGALADGYVNKNYEAKQIGEMMAETVNLLDLFREQMVKVKDSGLSAEDQKALDQMIDISDLLKKEAEALTAYSKSDKASDAKKYDKARVAAWAKIKVLLNISD